MRFRKHLFRLAHRPIIDDKQASYKKALYPSLIYSTAEFLKLPRGNQAWVLYKAQKEMKKNEEAEKYVRKHYQATDFALRRFNELGDIFWADYGKKKAKAKAESKKQVTG